MKNNSRLNKKLKGFTLVELLVVIAIIAILSTISVIGYSDFIKKAAISNDNLLANQINSLISGYRISEQVDDDNSIAQILQRDMGNDVSVQSQKYKMDIYYNTASKKFELMSNSDGEGLHNLDYYLNLVIFNINKYYNHEFSKFPIKDVKGDNKNLEVYFKNNVLIVEIWYDESGDESPDKSRYKIPTIDLTEIITATDADGNNLTVTFECDSGIIDGTKFTPTTIGNYKLRYSCQGIQNSIDLCVLNSHLPAYAEINTDQIVQTITHYDSNSILIKFNNIRYAITIRDYVDYNNNTPNLDISNLPNSIIMIIEIGNERHEKEININQLEYIVTFDSIDLNNYSEVSITYRYQGKNGAYSYSEPQIVDIEK